MSFFRRQTSPLSDAVAFQEFYECNRLAVFRYLYALTGGPQEQVEDLTAETFLRAWKARHRYQGELDTAIGWLLRIAKHLVIDEYRRTAQRSSEEIPEASRVPTPEHAVMLDQQNHFLLTLLNGLSNEQREILILRYMLGWRINTIAHHLGVSENNVSVNIHRTIAKLKDKWQALDSSNDHANVFLHEDEIS